MHWCGGAIIAENIILSAAHCFHMPRKEGVKPTKRLAFMASDYRIVAGTVSRLGLNPNDSPSEVNMHRMKLSTIKLRVGASLC